MTSTSSNNLRPPAERRSRSTSKQPIEFPDGEGSDADHSSHESNQNGEYADDGPAENTGGLSDHDHDERNNDERRVAEESPAKGKRRLSSMVSIDLYLPPLFELTDKSLGSCQA